MGESPQGTRYTFPLIPRLTVAGPRPQFCIWYPAIGHPSLGPEPNIVVPYGGLTAFKIRDAQAPSSLCF